MRYEIKRFPSFTSFLSLSLSVYGIHSANAIYVNTYIHSQCTYDTYIILYICTLALLIIYSLLLHPSYSAHTAGDTLSTPYFCFCFRFFFPNRNKPTPEVQLLTSRNYYAASVVQKCVSQGAVLPFRLTNRGYPDFIFVLLLRHRLSSCYYTHFHDTHTLVWVMSSGYYSCYWSTRSLQWQLYAIIRKLSLICYVLDCGYSVECNGINMICFLPLSLHGFDTEVLFLWSKEGMNSF